MDNQTEGEEHGPHPQAGLRWLWLEQFGILSAWFTICGLSTLFIISNLDRPQMIRAYLVLSGPYVVLSLLLCIRRDHKAPHILARILGGAGLIFSTPFSMLASLATMFNDTSSWYPVLGGLTILSHGLLIGGARHSQRTADQNADKKRFYPEILGMLLGALHFRCFILYLSR